MRVGRGRIRGHFIILAGAVRSETAKKNKKKVKCDGKTDRQTDRQTDGRTDRRTNGPTKRGVESRSTRLKTNQSISKNLQDERNLATVALTIEK